MQNKSYPSSIQPNYGVSPKEKYSLPILSVTNKNKSQGESVDVITKLIK